VTAESVPPVDAVRCEHCGALILETEWGWGDWNAPSLVFCDGPAHDSPDPLPTTRHRPALAEMTP
jgi:hypothetical protein